jgi:hypothetical protein
MQKKYVASYCMADKVWNASQFVSFRELYNYYRSYNCRHFPLILWERVRMKWGDKQTIGAGNIFTPQ